MLVSQPIFKERIGGVQFSLKFESIRPFLREAEDDLAREVGRPLFDAFLVWPDPAANPQTQQTQVYLVEIAQATVCWDAYQRAIPHFLNRFGDMGIMQQAPANTTPSTKWSVTAQLKDATDKYYRNLDILFEELERHLPAEWTNTPEYIARQGLLINSPRLFNNCSGIGGKNVRFFKKLTPFIEQAEELFIEPLLGTVEFNALKARYENLPSVPLTPEDVALLRPLRKALAAYTLLRAYPHLGLYHDENGIREQKNSDSFTEESKAGLEIRDRQIQELHNTALLYAERTRKYLAATASTVLYPAYFATIAPRHKQDYTRTPHVLI